MAYCDFVVEYSPNLEVLSARIIRNLFLNRLKYKKPTVVLITGDSGEAKSYITLSIVDTLLKADGLDLINYLDQLMIFTPHQYAEKMDALLYDKSLKKLRTPILDEAREVIDAKRWFEFVIRAIAHINAMFRRIKPMAVFVVTQFIGDIDKSMRRTVTFYGKCVRPQGKKPHLYLYRIWKDDRDLENPKMRKRRVFGYVKMPDGSRMKVMPHFRFKLPRKEIIRKYEKLNYEAKTRIIKLKLAAILKSLKDDIKSTHDKVAAMVDFYVNKPEALPMIIERRRGKMVLKKDFEKMQDWTGDEIREFKKALFEKLIERGVAYGDKKQDSSEQGETALGQGEL